MKKLVALALATVAFTPAIAASVPPRPELPPQKPVTETLFGTKVTDPYRYFEKQGPVVTDWMKAEGRYTRAVLDAVPQHDDILARLSAMTGSWTVAADLNRDGQKIFYEERSAGSDNYDLMVRDESGRIRKIVDVSAIRAANGGEPFAINYFSPSNDGTKVAVGISQGGSEDASIWVYDVATGQRIAGPVDRAQFGVVNWAPDDSGMFLNRLAELKPGAEGTEKYKNSRDYFWDMKSAPVPVLGTGVSPAVPLKPEEFPGIVTVPGSPLAFALSINGVQNEIAAWTAPVAEATRPGAHWTPLVSRADEVTNFAVVGDRIFLLSHKDAPTFKVLELKPGEPVSAARVVVPASPDRLIEAISAAADGLYIRSRRGVYSELTKVPLGGGAEQAVALPFKGSINELTADPRVPGAVIVMDSWAVSRRALGYDPARGFTDLALGTSPAGFDPSLYQALDLRAKAADGVEVPLSLVTATAAQHPRPVLLWAYGSYGISEFPSFGTRTMATLPNGIDLATCHVRGGGELGEAWRLGGKDANKPNTWRDLIACGEALIAGGYTTRDMLFIGGGSAGGITMGRAMEERPELFAGVLDLVPAANTVRSEFSPNGPPNIPEFGTVKTEAGFRNLLAMDSLLNLKPGADYPPVMVTTGLNDPRVSSWEPAKFAAALRAQGSPVLLRIDEKAGHGIGSTKTQTDQLYADVATFILMHSGGSTPVATERGR